MVNNPLWSLVLEHCNTSLWDWRIVIRYVPEILGHRALHSGHLFGQFLLLYLIELLVFGPIPPMPVEVIDYLERPLLVKSHGLIILPQPTCQLQVELLPVMVAVFLGTVALQM
jgi:hypothetical protein